MSIGKLVGKWLLSSGRRRGISLSTAERRFGQRRWRHTEEAVDFFEQPMNAAEEREAEKRVAEEQGLTTVAETSGSSNNAARERVLWCIDLCDSYGELAFSLNALKQSGLKLLPYDLPHIFKRIEKSARALTFYKWVKSETHLTLVSEAYDELVRMMCERKQFGTVWSLLGDMKNEKPAVPDFIFMTIFTTCCCKSQNPTEAAHFFDSMVDYRCKHSAPLYNCLVESFLRCSATKLAQKYMDKMEKERFQVSEKNRQLLATTLVKTELEILCDRIVARGVEVTPELCCETMIKLCKANNLDQALTLLKFMCSEKLHPTPEVVDTLARCLAEAERSSDALIVFKLLVNKINFRVSYLTCVWVASSLIMDLELLKAHRLSRYVRPSEVRNSFEFFVGRLSHATLMKAVWDLLRFMKYSGYQPDRATYKVCVKAANRAANRYISIKDIARAGGTSMTFPCNLLLKMLGARNHRCAWPLVRFMQSKNVSPNEYTYSRLIQMYFKADQMEFGWEAYAEMRKQGMFPLRWAYPCLVSDAAIAGKKEVAVELLEEMIDEWGIPSPSSSKKLIVWLCYHGSSDVALKIYRELKARGAVLKSSLRVFRCLRRVKTVHTRELLNEIDEDIVHRNLVKSKRLMV